MLPLLFFSYSPGKTDYTSFSALFKIIINIKQETILLNGAGAMVPQKLQYPLLKTNRIFY